MRRRSRAGGPGKPQRRKTAARKTRIVPKARPRSPPIASLEAKVARLAAELDEALERQSATANILGAISRSIELQSILQTVVDTASQLCRADASVIFRLEGGVYRFAAGYSLIPSYMEHERRNPISPGPGTLIGRAAMTRQVVQIEDALTDPFYEQKAVAGVGRSMMGVPLMSGDEPIGVIGLSRSQVAPFTQREIDLVTTFADQAVIAIENARLLNELRQRTDDLTESLDQQTATSEVLRVISSSPGELKPVFSAMLESATRICGATFGSMLLRDGDGYRRAAMHNASQKFSEYGNQTPVFTRGTAPTVDRVIDTRQALHVFDMAAEDPNEPIAKFGGARTLLVVPMLKENEAIGAIGIYRQEVRPFTDKQVELVNNFAAQAVIAIENARLLNELRQRTTDLTERTADLTEALEQQTATSEVLQVISSSPGDLEPVFAAMLEKAVRMCDASFGNIYRWQDGALHLVAAHNTPPALAEARRRLPLVPGQHPIIDRMVTTKTASHVIDAATTSEYIERSSPGVIELVELAGGRTALAVPMVRDNELIGSFTVYRQEVRPFTDKQIELVTNFAAQAVIAIENARLLNELRESLEQQTATSEVLDVIGRSAFDLHAVFETVVQRSAQLSGVAQARSCIMRFDGELMRNVAFCNVPPNVRDWLEQNPLRPGRHSCAARAALERRTIQIPDILADPEYSYAAKAIEPYRTLLAVPILKTDELLGVILIYLLEVKPFTDRQIALVETFADQAAIAIENARLLDALRLRTDDLGRSVDELRALGEVSQAVNSTLELETVLSTIVAKAVQLSGTEAGAIYVFDDLAAGLSPAGHIRHGSGVD